MVRNLLRAPKETGLKRLQTKTIEYGTPLCKYITSRSMLFFDLLSTNGQEIAKSFLQKAPALWSCDSIFQELSAKVKLQKVVNDIAELAISLIQTYNSVLTKDKIEKQYLLQLKTFTFFLIYVFKEDQDVGSGTKT